MRLACTGHGYRHWWKEKKDDLICDKITSQTPIDNLTPVVNITIIDRTDPIEIQFEENLTPRSH